MALQDIITNLGTAIINLVDRKILKHCEQIETVLLELKAKIDILVEESNSSSSGSTNITTQETLVITTELSGATTSVDCTVIRGYQDGKSFCDYIFNTPISLASAEGVGSGLYLYSGHLFTPNISANTQILYATNDSTTYEKSEESGYMEVTTSVPTKVNYGTKGLMSAKYLWEVYTEAETDNYTEITLTATYLDNTPGSN